MKADSFTLPVTLTPAQKRDRARRIKILEAELELGYKGTPLRINREQFLKEARKRYPSLAK